MWPIFHHWGVAELALVAAFLLYFHFTQPGPAEPVSQEQPCLECCHFYSCASGIFPAEKCSTVFSACLNSSPYPGTDQISPAQQGLLWLSQIKLMAPQSSKVEGEPLLMPSTRPFSSFISGRPAAWEHRLLSRHTWASVLALPFPKFMPLGSWPHLSVL